MPELTALAIGIGMMEIDLGKFRNSLKLNQRSASKAWSRWRRQRLISSWPGNTAQPRSSGFESVWISTYSGGVNERNGVFRLRGRPRHRGGLTQGAKRLPQQDQRH